METQMLDFSYFVKLQNIKSFEKEECTDDYSLTYDGFTEADYFQLQFGNHAMELETIELFGDFNEFDQQVIHEMLKNYDTLKSEKKYIKDGKLIQSILDDKKLSRVEADSSLHPVKSILKNSRSCHPSSSILQKRVKFGGIHESALPLRLSSSKIRNSECQCASFEECAQLNLHLLSAHIETEISANIPQNRNTYQLYRFLFSKDITSEYWWVRMMVDMSIEAENQLLSECFYFGDGRNLIEMDQIVNFSELLHYNYRQILILKKQ